MSRPPFYIRVSKDEDNVVRREVMRNGEKLADVSFTEVVEMIMQFTSSLRFEGTK